MALSGASGGLLVRAADTGYDASGMCGVGAGALAMKHELVLLWAFGALSGRVKFTVQSHKLNNDSCSGQWAGWRAGVGGLAITHARVLLWAVNR